MLRKHPIAWMTAAGVVVFALLGTGAVFAGMSWAAEPEPESVAAPTEEAVPPRPVAQLEASVIPVRTCSIATQAADDRLMELDATVLNAETGEVLFDRNGTKATPPASALKVLTAAAALSRLKADYRITTSVLRGAEPRHDRVGGAR